MNVTPLVVAKMVVTNLSYGVGQPGETEPAHEAVQFQTPLLRAPPPEGTPPLDVVSGSCHVGIVNKAMMKKLELGKTYKVIIVADDEP